MELIGAVGNHDCVAGPDDHYFDECNDWDYERAESNRPKMIFTSQDQPKLDIRVSLFVLIRIKVIGGSGNHGYQTYEIRFK